MAEVRGEEIVTKVRDILAPLGLEVHPFKVCKYFKTLLMIIRPLVEVKRQCFACFFLSGNEEVHFTVVIFSHAFSGQLERNVVFAY